MTPDARRVDKVVRLIGTSEQSWEDAARTAVAEAAKTIRELDRARLADLDIRVNHDGTYHYRVELEVSFRVDRYRTTPTGHTIRVRRLLVVGNRTLAQPALQQAMISRRLQGPLEVHVVVPREPAPLGPLLMGDPSSGVILTESNVLDLDRHTHEEAEVRLRDFLDYLRGLDIDAHGEIGSSNPVHAVHAVLARAEFDEIILATLSHTASKWLHLDVPSRLRRTTSTPIAHITTES